MAAMVSNDDWIQRWREGRTAWHEPEGSDALMQNWHARGKKVLVPLCGKAVDMVWLARRGHEVVGVELAERAIDEFFAEQGLTRSVTDGAVVRHRAEELPITILCGDYFAIEGLQCDALYDRGALVAVDPGRRAAYVSHTDSLLVDQPERLVVTLAYEQALVSGPPFAVTADEVRSYWPELELACERDAIDDVPPKFRQAGVDEVFESAWVTPSRN